MEDPFRNISMAVARQYGYLKKKKEKTRTFNIVQNRRSSLYKVELQEAKNNTREHYSGQDPWNREIHCCFSAYSLIA